MRDQIFSLASSLRSKIVVRKKDYQKAWTMTLAAVIILNGWLVVADQGEFRSGKEGRKE